MKKSYKIVDTLNVQDFLASKSKFLTLIGGNASGKTYNLLKFKDKNGKDNIYISEDASTEVYSNNVIIDAGYYIEEDIKTKGYGSRNRSSERIKENLLPILHKVDFILEKQTKKRFQSLGDKKFIKILKLLVSTNLNNVYYICIDEPENFLDDIKLRELASLLLELSKTHISIRIATHSYKLLEYLQLELNQIGVLNQIGEKIYIGNICRVVNISKLLNEYESIGKCVTKHLKCLQKKMQQENKKYDGWLYNHMTADRKLIEFMFNMVYCKNENFYRALFYNELLIVEGFTEEKLFRGLALDNMWMYNMFIANGKGNIPIFAILFSELGKKIVIILDKDTECTPAYVLTEYLENEFKNYGFEDIQIIWQTPDFESEYLNTRDIKSTLLGESLGIVEKDLTPETRAYLNNLNKDMKSCIAIHGTDVAEQFSTKIKYLGLRKY